MSSGESGCRTRFVTIQQLTETAPDGFPIETWTALGSKTWMELTAMSGAERFGANQLSAKVDAHWIMPYQPNMDPELVDVPKKRRLLVFGRVHDIVSAQPHGESWHESIELWTLATSKVS